MILLQSDECERGFSSRSRKHFGIMPSDILNFNKPCSACRRRKVRCDKAQPCTNCIRHGVSCIYEVTRESVMSQQLLQDRVERLERMMEDMAAYSIPNSSRKQSPRGSCSSGNSPLSSSDDSSDVPADAGSQVFRPSDSYHMGPDSWMSIDQFAHEPRHLLNVNCEDVTEENGLTWPLSPSSPKPKDMSCFHLPMYKEDLLLKLFFDHVEPFIRTSHQGHFWQLVTDYRQGTSASAREVEALTFAAQYITATVLPAAFIQEQIGMPKQQLSQHLQKATEFALDRANLMRSRNTILFNALLYYIVSSATFSPSLRRVTDEPRHASSTLETVKLAQRYLGWRGSLLDVLACTKTLRTTATRRGLLR